MIESEVKPLARQNRAIRSITIAVILILLVGMAAYAYNTFSASQVASPPQRAMVISESALEEEYGLRVNLIAVTAAGGLVDLRFKILDAEKAKQLLHEGKNLPQLAIADSGVVLNASEDSLPQGFKVEDDGNLYLMYPNVHNAVKPGISLAITFGDLQVEPIQAK